jgi:hypothetical protein
LDKVVEYVTIIQINGQVLLTKLLGDVDDNGFYTIENPLKPIVMSESSKVMFVAMNPFSNSVEFKLHASHIMTMGNMDESYIDVYNNAVQAILKQADETIVRMATPLEEQLEEIDLITPSNKTLH